jgi:hypothetical protein
MPILGILHIAIAVFFAIHALRTGRNMVWLFALLMFPFLGSLVYFFAEYLPGMRHSAVARKSVRAVGALVDPNRALRDAQLAFERTPTVDNRSRLAEALLARGDFDAAIEHYRACASGPYVQDAKFRRGLARAQLAGGRPAEAADTLTRLFADDPSQSRGEASLWLAQALAQTGDEADAVAAFEQAREAHPSTQTDCAYGLYLARIGRGEAARPLLERVLHNARVGTASSRELNRGAIEQARAALRALDQAGSISTSTGA